MKKVFLTLFTFVSSLLMSQNFDSLVYISIHLDSDTSRVNLFYSEGYTGRLKNSQFAYNCAKQAEYFAEKSKSNKHIAKANNLLGVLYYRKADLKKALLYHLKALEIRESLKDENGIAMSESNLGNIYSDINDFELAEQSYLHALQLSSKLGNEKQSANCYINLGVLKTNLKQFEEAEKYFYNAFKIAKITMDYELEAMCLNNLAVINIEKKEYEPAIGNCLDALKVKDIMGNEMDKTDSYINLAKAYFLLNDNLNSTYYLNKADSFCIAFEYTEAQVSLLELKEQIFESNKQFELALLTNKTYHRLKDSLNSIYESIQIENAFNDHLNTETLNPPTFRFPFLLLAILLFLSVLISFIIYRNKR